MKNKERIRFEMLAMEDSMFDCEIVASTKLFSAFFTPYIWQMNLAVNYQYSKMTGIANENVHCYPDWDRNEEPGYLAERYQHQPQQTHVNP